MNQFDFFKFNFFLPSLFLLYNFFVILISSNFNPLFQSIFFNPFFSIHFFQPLFSSPNAFFTKCFLRQFFSNPNISILSFTDPIFFHIHFFRTNSVVRKFQISINKVGNLNVINHLEICNKTFIEIEQNRSISVRYSR